MTLGEFSVVISIVGILPYLTGMFRGTLRPHRTSWFIWTIILALTLWGYWAVGARDSAWFIFGDLLVTGAVFVVSLWRGKGGLERLDLCCLVIAVVGVAVWQLSRAPVFVLFGTVMADAVSIVPTLVKALREPETESATPFLASSFAALCGVMAVGQWNMQLLFYPFYLFLANFVTGLVIVVSQYQVRHLYGHMVHNLPRVAD